MWKLINTHYNSCGVFSSHPTVLSSYSKCSVLGCQGNKSVSIWWHAWIKQQINNITSETFICLWHFSLIFHFIKLCKLNLNNFVFHIHKILAEILDNFQHNVIFKMSLLQCNFNHIIIKQCIWWMLIIQWNTENGQTFPVNKRKYWMQL